MTKFARQDSVWDSEYKVAELSDVWFSDAGSACTATAPHCARTRRVYDMTTGNVLEVWKPKQHAANTTRTTLAYDARKLFVATEVNEVGHQRDFGYEYGTGTKLLTSGPNIATCSLTVPDSCPPNTPFKEEHRIRVDGLGRTIERFETFAGGGGNNYFSVLVETNAFDPSATSVTHRNAISAPGEPLVYAEDTTDLDGHGRPIRQTQLVFGTAPANHVTTFVYKNDGTLGEVRLPDPTLNNTSTVSYTYAFDSLGRPTSRRPDSTTPASQSGVNISYDGLVTTSTEFLGAAGGVGARSRTTVPQASLWRS